MITLDLRAGGQETHGAHWGAAILEGTSVSVATVGFRFLEAQEDPSVIASQLSLTEAQVSEALRFVFLFERRR